MKASTWLIPLVGVGAVALGLGLWARRAVATQRAQAWEITRTVAQRLQTEEGARQLYRLNPELQARTPSLEAFLGEVRAHRAAFQALPSEPPREGYRCLPRLTSFTTQLRGGDGSWMELQVQGPSLLDRARGEGLHLLHFAPQAEALHRPGEAATQALNAALWDRYQAVLADLESPEGTRALWQREPGLHAAYPDPEALVAWAQAKKAAWAGLPRGPWAQALKVSFIRELGDAGETHALEYELEGRKLRMAWQHQRLIFLGFAPREGG